MNAMTIRQKLLFVFGVIIAIFAANGAYSEYSLYRINQGEMRIATEHLSSVITGMNSSQVLAEYRQGEYAVVMGRTVPERIYAAQMQRSRASQIDISLDAISKVLPEDKQQDLQAVRDSWKDYQAQAGATAAMVQDGRQDQAEQSLQQSEKAYQKLSESMGQVTDYSKDFIHEETKEAQVVYDRAKAMMLVCIVLVVVLAGIMAYYLSGSILRSVRNLMYISQEISAGNLTVEAKPQSKDEFGDLTRAYGVMIGNLRRLIDDIHQAAKDVQQFASQMEKNAEQSAKATQQVAKSIANVADSTSGQSEAVDASLQDAQRMSEELHGFADTAGQAAEAANSMEGIARKGKASIDGAVSQMSEIADSVKDSADVISKLAERSQEIGQISDTISEIADQTNLLALNAAIEAARAGEAGRGFSVVADEVRKLAEGSNAAAQQIAELIRSIQTDTEQAVSRMKKGTENVGRGREVVAEAGQSFEAITASVSELTQKAEKILNEAKQSSESAARLADTMRSIHDASQSVTQETESVSAATQEQSASMDEVVAASENLARLSERLSSSISKFHIE